MTVRVLLIEIDDERPLGPQLAAARRSWSIPWKLLRELAGGTSVRHLQTLAATAHFCERHTVQWKITVPPNDETTAEAAEEIL